MTKRILAFSLLILLAGATAAGCGSRYTTQEAYDACNELVERINTSATDEQFAECVACFEECGEDCQQSDDATTATFSCPED